MLANRDRRQFIAATSSALAALPLLQHSAFGQETPKNASDNASAKVASGSKGVVASVHPYASQAAIRAFERGGNAFDAAVAASLMLSVVDGFNSGIGGGGLATLRTKDGRILAIDGRETAPQSAAPEMFFRNGRPDPNLSQFGPLAAGCPGLLAALARISRELGTISWTHALDDAAKVAADGFALDKNYVGRLSSAATRLKQFPESARILLNSDGKAWKSGHRLIQADLSKTLQSIAKEGLEWFYHGKFAQVTEQFMTGEGGRLSAKDFHHYRALDRTPIQSIYKSRTVYGFPPPSSGGIHHAQMLGMLGSYDLGELFRESEATARHLQLEVMKRAMADRAYWLGDSDFAKVPRGLLDPRYLADRASSIDLGRATPIASHGTPPKSDVDLFGNGGHTTHLTTADAEGNVVALTQTINTTFGSKMIVPGTGVVLNNEMDDFSIAPGVRNAFGLLGSEANVIAPGKRPLSSMSPTIVVDENGSPILSCGAAGGPKIITSVLQVMLRVMELGETIDQALAAPRVHHQWSPDRAVCENSLEESVVKELEAKGHVISRVRSSAVSQGLQIQGSVLTAGSDPRVPSAAMSI